MHRATIYLLTFPDGARYVGQTVQPIAARMRLHRHHAKGESSKREFPVYVAWREQGPPQLRVLLVCEPGDDAHEYERRLILLHRAELNVQPAGRLTKEERLERNRRCKREYMRNLDPDKKRADYARWKKSRNS